MTPKILLTGSTGFVGQPLLWELVKRGYWVRTVSRDPRKFWSNEHIEGNLIVPAVCKLAVKGMDIVIHVAGEIRRRDLMWATNVEATRELGLAAIKAKAKRFVYIGTASTRHHTDYCTTKRTGELSMKAMCQGNTMELAIVSPPTLYGGKRGPKWLQGMKLWLMGRPINLASREDTVRDILAAAGLT